MCARYFISSSSRLCKICDLSTSRFSLAVLSACCLETRFSSSCVRCVRRAESFSCFDSAWPISDLRCASARSASAFALSSSLVAVDLASDAACHFFRFSSASASSAAGISPRASTCLFKSVAASSGLTLMLSNLQQSPLVPVVRSARRFEFAFERGDLTLDVCMHGTVVLLVLFRAIASL